MVTNFRAREGTLAYASGAVTWDAATNLSNETFTANINEVKDVTVTPPEMAYDKIDLIGNTAQTIGANAQTLGVATGINAGNFQNQAVQKTAVTMWKVTGTLVLTGNEQFIDVFGLGTATATSGGAASRYSVGAMNSGGDFDRSTIGSTRLFLNNGSEETTVVLSNVYPKLGDIKPTGMDGYFERDFEIMCLAKDGAIEFQD